MQKQRTLFIVAEDYGIGPATSKAIVKLAVQGRITGTGFMVNSPYAKEAVQAWQQTGQPMELGWQPCLTIDSPILSPKEVPSLVEANGRFFTLSKLISRLIQGRIRRDELFAELEAQYETFYDLTKQRPLMIAPKHHVQLLPRIGAALLQLLSHQHPKPYFRRIRETLLQWVAVRGARWKRLLLSTRGRRFHLQQSRLGFPGNDYLAGLTNPAGVNNPSLMNWWLTWTQGENVELACRPGYYDGTLIERVYQPSRMPAFCRWMGTGFRIEEQLEQRVKERELLEHEDFLTECDKAGFTLKPPSALVERNESPTLTLRAA